MTVEYYLKSFKELKEKVKEDENNFEERDFYSLIEDIKEENRYLFEQAENHPKYNFVPTKDVPESISLEILEKLIIEIESYIKSVQPFDTEEELDIMFPDRHDEDFDEDSMNYDSIFGGD
jgi:hypothetical protein